MIKRQNIDIQYLRLLSVTLMFTAVYVSDNDEFDARIAALEDVREIILDQINQNSQVAVDQEINWEKALEAADIEEQSSSLFTFFNPNGFYFEVLPVLGKSLEFNDILQESHIQTDEITVKDYHYPIESGFCKYSYHCPSHPSRAGPLA